MKEGKKKKKKEKKKESMFLEGRRLAGILRVETTFESAR